MPGPREVRNAVLLGLIGGAGLIYLCVVGIVAAFADRNVITGALTLGRIMLMVPPLTVGFLAGRRLVRPTLPGRLLAGAVAGAVAGAILGLGLLLASSVDIRGIFLRTRLSSWTSWPSIRNQLSAHCSTWPSARRWGQLGRE